MKRVLLLKLTSLGDLIHTLPALTDAAQADPNLRFDWIIDESFAEIASWHPAIDRIFLTSHRIWRKGMMTAIRPILRLIQKVRKTRYDLIIDGQGNFKTALLSLFFSGPRAGFDRQSVREWIASFAYHRKFPAPKNAHAIERLRQLFALSLGYPCPSTPPDFGIDRRQFTPVPLSLPEPYLVFIHSAAWTTKLWPEKHWIQLIQWMTQKNYTIFLPWGNEEERKRAERLAIHPKAIVLPKLSLCEIGTLLSKACACVCMDTGLSHLAAALNVSSITLYGATDARRIGTSGHHQIHFQGHLPCAPCHQKTCCMTRSPSPPPCLAQIGPEQVFQQLLDAL